MRAVPPTITSLPPSPADERNSRMFRYFVAMIIRVICFLLILVLPDWWRVIPLIGAVFLPYFAVVAANASTTPPQAEPERPIAQLEGGEWSTEAAPDPTVVSGPDAAAERAAEPEPAPKQGVSP